MVSVDLERVFDSVIAGSILTEVKREISKCAFRSMRSKAMASCDAYNVV